MSKSTVLRRVVDAVRGLAVDARQRIAELDGQIAELREQRAQMETATPHVDDLVEWFERGIDRYQTHFMKRASCYLNAPMIESRGWSAFDDPEVWRDGFSAFHLDSRSDVPHGNVSPIVRNIAATPPDASALVALLAPMLRQAARGFILELLPQTEHGMRLSERTERLAEIDARLADLANERQEIITEMSAVIGAQPQP